MIFRLSIAVLHLFVAAFPFPTNSLFRADIYFFRGRLGEGRRDGQGRAGYGEFAERVGSGPSPFPSPFRSSALLSTPLQHAAGFPSPRPLPNPRLHWPGLVPPRSLGVGGCPVQSRRRGRQQRKRPDLCPRAVPSLSPCRAGKMAAMNT